MNKILTIATLFISFTILSCAQKKSDQAMSPPGYDLTKNEKFNMPDILQEVSGIAFDKGDSKIVYAQQDEDGSVFRLPLGTKDDTETKFAKKGDYEDISVIKEKVMVLKSNGDLYAFPIAETAKEETTQVKETKDILPKGEYEGLYGDEATGDIYVLCKNCKDDDKKVSTVYVLALQSDDTFKTKSEFTIDVSEVDKLSGKKKGAFKPSALAKNPITGEWFIVSSVNKAILVADAQGKIKDVYHLNANDFNQPEGIAFDKVGNMYISNEGSETTLGNILKFEYKKK